MIELEWGEVSALAAECAAKVEYHALSNEQRYLKVYPIPNGGIFAAQAVLAHIDTQTVHVELVSNPKEADIYVDDLIDSGKTAERWKGKPFIVLIDKREHQWNGEWVSFPWERQQNQEGPEDNIRRILQFIGEDPEREGLKETPERVVRSYKELFSGYKQDPKDFLKVFEDGACDEMVMLKGIQFYSSCEHHMLPFFGRASVAYIPDGKIIGLSKLARLVEVYSRRLQVQERLTQQITKALDDYLEPKGSACVIEGKHFCMMCRGVMQQESVMVTSSLTGVFKEDDSTRAEFLSMVKS